MSQIALIHIIGTPVACEDGVKESWRKVAQWAGRQLQARYGTAVSVAYFDLFDPACPPLAVDAQLPLVVINGQVVASGGIISLPLICRHLDTLLPGQEEQ